MPSNWLFVDAGFPTFTGEESADEKIEKMQNYVFMLVEQLRHSLHNIDLRNFNQAAVKELGELLTEPIFARLEDTDGNIAALQATAQGLAGQISDAEGNITALQATASGLASRVSDAEGNISTVTQTANGLVSTVAGIDGRVTSLQQTVDGFDFTGVVRFSDLSTPGQTTIDGANVRTGTIDADSVSVTNSFSLISPTGYLYGYMGLGRGFNGSEETYGAMLASTNQLAYFIATEEGARMTYRGAWTFLDKSIYVTGSGCFSTETIQVASDRRLKSGIRYDMERYEDMFRRLRPCAFRLRSAEEDGFHTGFIAQEVEQARISAGLGPGDFAGLKVSPEGRYTLGYGEFAALNCWMIQRLTERVEKLEEVTGDGKDDREHRPAAGGDQREP